MNSRSILIGAALGALTFTPYPASADCIRSCTAHLYVELSYQPQGAENVQRKTPNLKTRKSETRDGRYGGGCSLSGIIKAKERACTDAVQAVMRRYRGELAQKNAVCESVAIDATLFDRAKAGFPEADWYALDKVEAYGKRDLIARRGALEMNRARFTCQGETALLAGAPPPTPPRPSGAEPAPPPAPPTGSAPAPAPSPPTESGKPDLIILQAALTPTGECTPRRAVLTARATVRNVGRATAPAAADFAMVNAMNTRMNWGNGKKMEAIPPGQNRTVEFPILFLQNDPPAMAGHQVFRFKVDPGNRIEERDENNNAVERTVEVRCP